MPPRATGLLSLLLDLRPDEAEPLHHEQSRTLMLKHLRRRSSAPAGDAASLSTPTPGVLSRARTMAGKYRDVAVLALAAPIAVFLVLDYAILPTVLSEHDHAAQTPAGEEVSAAAAILRFIMTRIHKRVGAPLLPVPASTTTAVTGAWPTNNATLLLEANFFCPANVSERRLMLSEGNRSETQTMLIACPTLRRVVFCQVTAGYAFCPSEFNSTYEQLTQLRTSMRNCRLNCRQTRKPSL